MRFARICAFAALLALLAIGLQSPLSSRDPVESGGGSPAVIDQSAPDPADGDEEGAESDDEEEDKTDADFQFPDIDDNPPEIPSSVLAALDGKSREEVTQALLNDLVKEIEGIHEATEADEKRGKSIRQLLKELEEKNEKTFTDYGKEYTQKYALMALKHISENVVEFRELAEELSVGSYDKLQEKVPEWGAAAFGQIVSDSLEELGHERAKEAWDLLVADADTLKEAAIALARGQPAAAFDGLKSAAKKKGKEYSKELAGRVVNWVFEPVTNADVGALYVQLLEAEISFIAWSQRYLRDEYAVPCLDLYVKKFEDFAPGDPTPGLITPFNAEAAGLAYHEYELCSVGGQAAVSFREIEAAITTSGVPRETVYIAMLEAYRRYRTMPNDWLAQSVRARQGEVETEAVGALATIETRLEVIADGVMGAIRERLLWLAWAKLDEEKRQDLLAQQARERAAQAAELDAALKEARPLWEQLRRLQAAAVGSCGVYDAAKRSALSVLNDAEEKQRALDRLSLDLDTESPCGSAPEVERKLNGLVTKAEDEKRRYDAALQNVKQGLDGACGAADAVKAAASKEAARAEVERCREATRQTATAIAATEANLVTLARFRDEAATMARSLGDEEQARAGERLDGFRQSIDELKTGTAKIAADFDGAKRKMGEALGHARGQGYEIERIAGQIIGALERFRNAPDHVAGAADAMAMLRGAEETRDGASADSMCLYRIVESWEHGDLDSGPLSWRLRDVTFVPPVEVLAGRLTRLASDCESASAARAAADRIAALHDAAAAEDVLFDIARQGSQECMARSLVAYDERWLSPRQVPALAGLPKDEAASRLAALGLGVAFADGEASATKAGTVQSQAPDPGAAADPGAVVTLRIFQQPAADEPAFAAAGAAIDACRFKDAGQLIAALPPGARRSELEAKLKARHANETEVRALYDEAKPLEAGGKLVDAIGRLEAAQARGPCPQTEAALAKGIARLKAKTEQMEGAGYGAADTAIAACRFQEASDLVRVLPAGPRRDEVQAKLTGRYADEKAARELYKAAQALEAENDAGGAIAKLEAAKAHKPCAATLAAIDGGLGRLRGRASETQESDGAVTTREQVESQDGQGSVPADADAARWQKSWVGTVRLTSMTIDGARHTSYDAAAATIRRLAAESAAAEQAEEEEDAGVAELGAGAADAVMAGLGEAFMTIALVVVDMGFDGVPLGFALKPKGAGFTIEVPGMPAEYSEMSTSSVGVELILKAVSSDALGFEASQDSGDWRNRLKLALGANGDGSKSQLKLELGMKKLTPPSGPSEVGEISLVLEGALEPGEVNYDHLVEDYTRLFYAKAEAHDPEMARTLREGTGE